MEIIPAIDIIDGKTVRLHQGDFSRMSVYADDPVDLVKTYVDYGFGRIHVVDLDGARTTKPVNLRLLEEMAKVGGARIEWSGGIKSDNAIEDVISAGASYVCVGSAAVSSPGVFSGWLEKYGPDMIVLGADARNGKISIMGWYEESDLSVCQLVDRYVDYGLSQVMVTDINKDGTLDGPDFSFYMGLQKRYPAIDFCVSGGVSSISDLREAAGMGLRRVIVGKALYENKIDVKELSSLNH